ncbi:DUF945 family protein [Celerinatantimonas sp. MCCC 1A17872]|uniref:DUF945 family protein n=1 Tax=Celerinatantimonas sp. MCCC 1A17872 TaxID=3177514 RepID=UPI0038C052D9
MNKKVTVSAAVVVVVAAGLVAAPYVVKSKVKPKFTELQVPQNIADTLAKHDLAAELKNVSYEDHGLTADTVTRVIVHKEGHPDNKLCFDISSKLDFGYGTFYSGNLVKADSKLLAKSQDPKCGFIDNPALKYDRGANELFGELFKDGSPLTATTILNWSGDVNQATINIVPRTLHEPNRRQGEADIFDVKAGQLTISRNSSHDKVQSKFHWDGFHWQDYSSYKPGVVQADFTLGAVDSKSSQSRVSDTKYMWTGTSSIHIAPSKFVATNYFASDDGKHETYQLGGINIDFTSSAADKKLTSTMDLKLSDLDIKGSKIANGEAKVTVSNISTEAMDDLLGIFQENGAFVKAHGYQRDEILANKLLSVYQNAKLTLDPVKVEDNGKEISISGSESVGSIDPKMVQMLGIRGLVLGSAKSLVGDVNLVIDTQMANKLATTVMSIFAHNPQSLKHRTERVMRGVTRSLQRQVDAGYLNYDKAADRYTTKLHIENGHVKQVK